MLVEAGGKRKGGYPAIGNLSCVQRLHSEGDIVKVDRLTGRRAACAAGIVVEDVPTATFMAFGMIANKGETDCSFVDRLEPSRKFNGKGRLLTPDSYFEGEFRQGYPNCIREFHERVAPIRRS